VYRKVDEMANGRLGFSPDGIFMVSNGGFSTSIDVKSLEGTIQTSAPDVNRILKGAAIIQIPLFSLLFVFRQKQARVLVIGKHCQ